MSVSLLQLWLPILLGAILAWVASGLIHMVLKYHNSDYKRIPNEDAVTAAVRDGAPVVGFYSFPHCATMDDWKDESIHKKFIEGPVGFLTIMPSGMPTMGKTLTLQFSFYVVGCFLIAYCASLALAPGAQYLDVFRVVSAVAFLAFGWATIPYSIWYGHPWSTTFKYLVDALVYALLVAGTFAWLWPAAV